MSQADEDELRVPPAAEAELLALLEAALRPAPLEAERAERLLELALEDPLAPPSAEELAESARLRDALAGGAAHDDAGLLRALRAPFAPLTEQREVERALNGALGAAKPRGTLLHARFGVAAATLAAAAAVALFVTQLQEAPPQTSAPSSSFVKPHTTADLFDDRFETSDTSQRMDRIASARSRDLRDNRYAAWGVR